jgi:hypothetical protein
MDMVNLRATVEQVDREIGALPATSAALRGAWAQLLGVLAFGPAPATRECPNCGRPGMRDATLCGYCWKKLTPLPAAELRDALARAR